MKSRSRGMLLGLAIGDALGAPVEFLPGPGSLYIEEMGDIIAHFHDNYRNPKGVWTDDTEMALCIADTPLKMPKCPILRTRFEDDEDFKTPD